MDEDKSISQVVKDDLCTGCGTCVALCLEEAMVMVIDEKKGIYVPELNEDKCKNCGICYKVCPGHEVDFKALNLEIFGKEPEDVLIGNYLNCYVGHATDYDIRYNSASGGLVTQLLIFALEEGIIDGALVTRMKKDKTLEPEPFIARTKEEIIEASKSKYCPVPANIALRVILESKEGERFAVVGLPCHIHGIRKAERINKKLKEKIVLHIGLFCEGPPNFLGTEFLLNKKIGVKKEDVKKLDYRGEGWPGGISITLKNGDKKFISHSDVWDILGLFFYYPMRCTLCCDGVCELADISFGDAWLPEFEGDNVGRSVIISKTEICEEILRNMISKKKINLKKVDKYKAIQTQDGGMLYFKKNLNSRTFLLKLYGKSVPTYKIDVFKPKIVIFPKTILLYSHISLSSQRYLWGVILPYISLLRVVGKVLRFIGMRP